MPFARTEWIKKRELADSQIGVDFEARFQRSLSGRLFTQQLFLTWLSPDCLVGYRRELCSQRHWDKHRRPVDGPCQGSAYAPVFPVATPHILCDTYVAYAQEPEEWANPNSISCKALWT
jgi:hypothetical protein